MQSATTNEVFGVLRRIDGRVSDFVSLIERTCKAKATSRCYPTLVKILGPAKSV